MKTFDEHPLWMQELMLQRQVEQGNPRNPDVFRENIYEDRLLGGFNWYDSKESSEAWSVAISKGDYFLLIKANPGITSDKPTHYTVSYDGDKHFILQMQKPLSSRELELITSVLHAAGHTQVQIESGVPPTPAIQEQEPIKCPECLKTVHQHELDMFGGLCEECSGAFNLQEEQPI